MSIGRRRRAGPWRDRLWQYARGGWRYGESSWLAEEALDEIELLVDVGIMADAGGATAAGGDDGVGAYPTDCGAEMIGIISTVGRDIAAGR